MLACGLVALACAEEPPEPTPARPPNVLIVLWDTVRADRLSAYGFERPTTPFLEAFARQGLLYERAISPGMWTLPSHGSLFTGLPARTHGVSATHKWLDHRFETLAEIFSREGYATYAFSSNPHVSEASNLTQGFADVDSAWEAPWNERVREVLARKLRREDQSTERRSEAPRPIDFKESGEVIPEAFGAWLDRKQGRPFFAYLNYMEAHLPRIPSLAARRAVMSPARLARSFEVSQKHVELLAAMFGQHQYDAEELAVIREVYDAALVDLDAATGKLVQALERRGVLDSTIVVITSDHGENVGDHGLFGHKYALYDSLVRVPLVIRYPKAVSPGRVEEAVGVVDVFATLLELAGLPPAAGVPSRSLLAPGRSSGPAVSELRVATPNALRKVEAVYGAFDWRPWLRTYRSLERGGYKVIRASDATRELFHVARDPEEAEDRAAEEPERATALEHELDAWLEQVTPYDPAAASPEDVGKPLPAELRERLEALGYAN